MLNQRRGCTKFVPMDSYGYFRVDCHLHAFGLGRNTKTTFRCSRETAMAGPNFRANLMTCRHRPASTKYPVTPRARPVVEGRATLLRGLTMRSACHVVMMALLQPAGRWLLSMFRLPIYHWHHAAAGGSMMRHAFDLRCAHADATRICNSLKSRSCILEDIVHSRCSLQKYTGRPSRMPDQPQCVQQDSHLDF